MPIEKPYHRIHREFINRSNSGYSSWAYIMDREYANLPHHYTRAFFIIQKDLLNIFEFIEPADVNLIAYSFRIHELLMRICIEIEANFKQSYGRISIPHEYDKVQGVDRFEQRRIGISMTIKKLIKAIIWTIIMRYFLYGEERDKDFNHMQIGLLER
jgi:hypothetical protein